ncbi:MAG: hypothetical protein JRI74_00950 [Deltaproteobacteria bacterium]|nr:hypothetical protein [Deltaproteobacteria bacterium]MBW2216193.1 hypothetical protein [Deltaproteobacteria bacterium]
MKGTGNSNAVMMWVGILAAFFFLVSGCAHSNKDQEEDAVEMQDMGLAPPIYYDFGDVRVPDELKVDNKASFVYKTPGFSAGVLVLAGNVEIYSLIAFFENSMNTDRWEFVSSFKSPRTIMIFKKQDRRCVINITEKKFSTLVEIWVAPTVKKD